MSKNDAYTQEYLDIIESLQGDIPGRKAAFSYMENSTATVHYIQAESSFVPRLFDRATYDTMSYIATTSHTIATKVMAHYLEDSAYRSLFTYDERMADLIMIPRRYDALLPFARFDIFMDEHTFQGGFCEWNGDGSSGMNEDRELAQSLAQSATFKEFARRHTVQTSDLFNPWVKEFISIYNTFENKVAHPTIAIMDYMENAVVDEFKVYAQHFNRAGYPCFIEDVRKVRYKDGILRGAAGQRIDAVWRRAVSNDLLAHWEESQDFISAVRDGAVALIGSFAGHIVHDKQIFEALYWDETRTFLTQEECDFVDAWVPFTTFLHEDHIDLGKVSSTKDEWIIKPTDQYGAHDVYAGKDLAQPEWDALIERLTRETKKGSFLVQRFLTPYRTPVLPICNDMLSRDDKDIPRAYALYHNMPGLYTFNGKFAGVFARLGPNTIISQPQGDLTSSVLWVDCDL